MRDINFKRVSLFETAELRYLLGIAQKEAKEFAEEFNSSVLDRMVEFACRGYGEVSFYTDGQHEESVGFSILDVRNGRSMGGLTYVLPEWRNRGIGTELRKRMLKAMDEEGIKVIPFRIKKNNKISEASIEKAAEIEGWGLQKEFSFDPAFNHYALLRK